MGARTQVDTASVVAAYLRFVAMVGRLLTVTAPDSVVAKTRDDADGSAAFAGMAVVQAALRPHASTSQRAAIDRALFTDALKPRFPGPARTSGRDGQRTTQKVEQRPTSQQLLAEIVEDAAGGALRAAHNSVC